MFFELHCIFPADTDGDGLGNLCDEDQVNLFPKLKIIVKGGEHS